MGAYIRSIVFCSTAANFPRRLSYLTVRMAKPDYNMPFVCGRRYAGRHALIATQRDKTAISISSGTGEKGGVFANCNKKTEMPP